MSGKTKNKKAQQYDNKNAQIKGLNAPNDGEGLSMAMMGQMFGQLLQVTRELNNRVSTLENRLKTTATRAKSAEYRSLAMLNVLNAKGTLTMGEVLQTVLAYHIEEFEAGSAQQDQMLGLTNADGDAVEKDMFVIVTVKVTDKDGNTLEEENVVRAKVVVGDENEFIAGFNTAVLGKKVGDTFALTVGDKTATVEVLGLRRPPVETAPETTEQGN